MTIPPPMPSNPERKPTDAPTSARNTMKEASILFLHEDALRSWRGCVEHITDVRCQDVLLLECGDKPTFPVLRNEDEQAARGLGVVHQYPFGVGHTVAPFRECRIAL